MLYYTLKYNDIFMHQQIRALFGMHNVPNTSQSTYDDLTNMKSFLSLSAVWLFFRQLMSDVLPSTMWTAWIPSTTVAGPARTTDQCSIPDIWF